ncbi:MAG TPA: ATP-binding protein [Phycisphaerales bacterium]|nr:ATP-binding protein [Phycisphaerales bacterium]
MSPGQDDQRALGLEGTARHTPGRAAGRAQPEPARGDNGNDAALLRRLARSQARYKAIVTVSSNLVWVRDAQLRFTEPCPDWERFTGQRYEEYAGHGWIDAIHPEDQPRVREKMHHALETAEPMIRLRYRLRHLADQGTLEWRHVEITASPVQDDDGQVIEWVGMVQDRTAQHEWESQKARQTEELARSNRDLEDFAYIAAHDLKEPLRGIRLIASFLEEDSQSKLDEDGKRRIAQLQELCGRMQMLLDSLLESAKVSSVPMTHEWLEVPGVVGEAVQLVGARVREGNAQVSVHESAHGVRLWGDPARLAQVLANLIANGIKYNESPAKTIEVGVASRDGGQATLYVRDNGIGVPEDKHCEVFRMFRRLHPRECYGGGAGAGLSIVKKIVERHAGRVWLESDGPGKGSTVYLTLPTEPGHSS